MFTGIVEAVGTITALKPHESDLSIEVDVAGLPLDDVKIGDSICVSGCCLTVTSVSAPSLTFDLSGETLALTLFGKAEVGTTVNLEKAMAATDRFGGHIVSGHIDGLGEMSAAHDDGRSTRMQFMVPREHGRFIAQKGSITIDGVSLTVNDVVDAREGTLFGVNLVPHTLEVTTLGNLAPGRQVHVEVDMIARYVERIGSFSE